MNKIFTISNVKGLHARAAAKLVKAIDKFIDDEITVSKDGLSVSGHSIMGLMMLGASFNTKIEVSCNTKNSFEILSIIEDLIDAKFYED